MYLLMKRIFILSPIEFDKKLEVFRCINLGLLLRSYQQQLGQ